MRFSTHSSTGGLRDEKAQASGEIAEGWDGWEFSAAANSAQKFNPAGDERKPEMNNGETITDLTSMVLRHLSTPSLSMSERVEKICHETNRAYRELNPAITPGSAPSISVLKPIFHFVKVTCRNCDGSGRVCAGSWTDQTNCICDECGGRGHIEYRLRTEYVFPPIPDRSMDWSAYDDNTYDADYDYEAQRYVSTSIVGRGATEQEAIDNFLEQMSERNWGGECSGMGSGSPRPATTGLHPGARRGNSNYVRLARHLRGSTHGQAR